ncbi:uncharacterized protein RHO25_005520 [Cercospora beticola]|uniref:Uncharacterized protein n=1 Tax=Cercospora beticola TaxID=122368 RepID=A0ABZ0NN47_CERBT|nr:hypothetical protein RHO25_005520 [Cercospora beticola]
MRGARYPFLIVTLLVDTATGSNSMYILAAMLDLKNKPLPLLLSPGELPRLRSFKIGHFLSA